MTMNAKTIFAAFAAAVVATASCQHKATPTDYDAEIRQCDSIIAHCHAEFEHAASSNRCNGLSFDLLEALEAKDSLLWLRLMDRCAGDEKLFMYQQFQYDRTLYRMLCDRNDSISYHQDIEDPWWLVTSNSDKIDWMERHIRILQQHTREQ